MHYLISLPPCCVSSFHDLLDRSSPEYFGSCDPPGHALGSGGGAANLLAEGWKASGAGVRFVEWLARSRKVILHAGGRSRRLPAYAPVGKLGVPIPVVRWMRGQRLDQTLFDMQETFFRDIESRAPANTVALVASGDVLLRCNMSKLSSLPDADVVLVGLWGRPETAQNHGVFFCDRGDSGRLAFALQKPSLEEIRRHAATHHFLIDSGLWLLGERAIKIVMAKSGWDWKRECFAQGSVLRYDLYSGFSQGLGEQPSRPDADISSLSCAVVALPDAEFYHFGTSRDLILSCARLWNSVLDQREIGTGWVKPHPEMFVLNAPTSSTVLTPQNRLLWIENAAVTDRWRLKAEHVITGVPNNEWTIAVPAGGCLDCVPVGDDSWCVRVYGFDDSFRGALGDAATMWCGQAVAAWFERRGMSMADAGIEASGDIQEAPLFPLVTSANLSGEFVQWLLDPTLCNDGEISRRRWLSSQRLSADEICRRANLQRLHAQRRAFTHHVLPALAKNASRSVFYLLDLDHTAKLYAETSHAVPPSPDRAAGLLNRTYYAMFSGAVARYRANEEWVQHEAQAFALLRQAFVDSVKDARLRPHNTVLEDQIIWARSPVRIDLAGGWTDTPPYCVIQGGRVINVAVDLNGQPPIQVFARRTRSLVLAVRSIDLGVEERIHSFEELTTDADVASPFSVARTALRLAGFDPALSGRSHAALCDMLDDFGGGIELSLLAAVPKGSGLGTSSILAGTILGALGDFCGLGWDQAEIFRRVLVLEQMLTTGGGWQDQVGGLVRGLKCVETSPGLAQSPQVRWLPDHLFTDPQTQQCMLLYYTGVTRIAKSILQEIVRGMFLNSRGHQAILREMSQHAAWSYEALLRGSYEGLCRCVSRSWELNQRLDRGTNPPAVQTILDRVGDLCAAAKLAGAGGGGYLFMLAKDPQAAARIRHALAENPPNENGRFVDCRLSPRGMEITRS